MSILSQFLPTQKKSKTCRSLDGRPLTDFEHLMESMEEFDTFEEAKAVADTINAQIICADFTVEAYQCSHCGKFHVKMVSRINNGWVRLPVGMPPLRASEASNKTAGI